MGKNCILTHECGIFKTLLLPQLLPHSIETFLNSSLVFHIQILLGIFKNFNLPLYFTVYGKKLKYPQSDHRVKQNEIGDS